MKRKGLKNVAHSNYYKLSAFQKVEKEIDLHLKLSSKKNGGKTKRQINKGAKNVNDIYTIKLLICNKCSMEIVINEIFGFLNKIISKKERTECLKQILKFLKDNMNSTNSSSFEWQRFLNIGLYIEPKRFLKEMVLDSYKNKNEKFISARINIIKSNSNKNNLIHTLQQLIHNEMNKQLQFGKEWKNYLDLGLSIIPKFFLNDLISYYYANNDESFLSDRLKGIIWSDENLNCLLKLLFNSLKIPFLLLDILKNSSKSELAKNKLKHQFDKGLLKEEYEYYIKDSMLNNIENLDEIEMGNDCQSKKIQTIIVPDKISKTRNRIIIPDRIRKLITDYIYTNNDEDSLFILNQIKSYKTLYEFTKFEIRKNLKNIDSNNNDNKNIIEKYNILLMEISKISDVKDYKKGNKDKTKVLNKDSLVEVESDKVKTDNNNLPVDSFKNTNSVETEIYNKTDMVIKNIKEDERNNKKEEETSIVRDKTSELSKDNDEVKRILFTNNPSNINKANINYKFRLIKEVISTNYTKANFEIGLVYKEIKDSINGAKNKKLIDTITSFIHTKMNRARQINKLKLWQIYLEFGLYFEPKDFIKDMLLDYKNSKNENILLNRLNNIEWNEEDLNSIINLKDKYCIPSSILDLLKQKVYKDNKDNSTIDDITKDVEREKALNNSIERLEENINNSNELEVTISDNDKTDETGINNSEQIETISNNESLNKIDNHCSEQDETNCEKDNIEGKVNNSNESTIVDADNKDIENNTIEDKTDIILPDSNEVKEDSNNKENFDESVNYTIESIGTISNNESIDDISNYFHESIKSNTEIKTNEEVINNESDKRDENTVNENMVENEIQLEDCNKVYVEKIDKNIIPIENEKEESIDKTNDTAINNNESEIIDSSNENIEEVENNYTEFKESNIDNETLEVENKKNELSTPSATYGCQLSQTTLIDNSTNNESELSNCCQEDNLLTSLHPSVRHSSDTSPQVEALENNLYKSGVSESECKSFASYLLSAYMHRIPVLLAGPCGEQIANAFSASICGAMPYVFDCKKEYSTNLIEDILKSKNEVVVIKHPFASKWRETLLELLAEGEKFYILINPFYEDLQIEPMSLYNSVMPFITELIIDKPPIIETLKPTKIELPEPTNKFISMHNELLKDMKLSPYCINQIQTLLSEMHHILGNDSTIIDYKYVLFPYAYVTNQGDCLAEKWLKIDKDAERYISKYFKL